MHQRWANRGVAAHRDDAGVGERRRASVKSRLLLSCYQVQASRERERSKGINTAQKVIKGRAGLLELAKQLVNVSQVCKVMSYSWDSFSRFKELSDEAGEAAVVATTGQEATGSQNVGRELPLVYRRI
jgi:hypothetical protein